MDLVLFGLSHVTAPLEVRECLSFKPAEAEKIMQDLQSRDVFCENLLLSTCNRIEIYGVADKADESLNHLRQILSNGHSIRPELLKDHEYTYLNIKAVQHLFRVAAGLDSLVVGEVEILGQIKDAYRSASGVDTTGPYLNRLFQHCFLVGKRARTETGISDGAISIGSIAVDLANKVLGQFHGKKALLIGAGETGALVAKHLADAGIEKFTVANRTRSKADELAKEMGGTAVEFDRIPDILPDFDVVITAIGAPERTVTRSMLRGSRKSYPLFIDLGVPRDIDPDIDKLPGVFVYNIDDLQTIANEKIARRELEIPRVENIINEETAKFVKWHQSVNSQQTIADLRASLEKMRAETLDKYRKQLNPHEYKLTERITEELLNKILHIPSQSLKGCELKPGPRHCESCDMFERGEGPVHGHYNQELKNIFTRILFDLEGKDRDA
jgi:glutamyl-tRNA reductase